MPYGKDFLDTVNDILTDSRQVDKIAEKCTECHGKMWGSDGGTICEACKKAKLVDWDGQRYTSTGLLDDIIMDMRSVQRDLGHEKNTQDLL